MSLTVLPLEAIAGDYYVDSTHPDASDGNTGLDPALPWLTIGKCASTIAAGDRCNVAAGSYSGWTETTSGSSGNRIVYRAFSGQPVVTGDVNVGGTSYVTVEGFRFVNGDIICRPGSPCTFLEVLNNRFEVTGNCHLGFADVDGDDILVSGNTFTGLQNDVFRSFGDRWVVRDNVVQNQSAGTAALGCGSQDPIHFDFFQHYCTNGVRATSDFILLENNLFSDIGGSQSHFNVIHLDGTCAPGDKLTNFISRYNRTRAVGASGGPAGFDVTDGAAGFRGAAVYNNTTVQSGFGVHASWQDYDIVLEGVDGGTYFAPNNLLYDAVDPVGAEVVYPPSASADCSLVFDPNNTVTTDGALRASKGSIVNKDPMFVDAAHDNFDLSAGSPGIDAGCPLTSVATADTGSGTTLVVGAAWFFQAGWAGVEPDCIAVGTVSNTACIVSINYGANTITLASGISRSDGDPVWLYRKSDGAVVLEGSAPDIGARESGAAGGGAQLAFVSIRRQNPSNPITNADTLVFRLTFSENVQNVDAGDFAVSGGTTAAVTNVATVAASTVFDVTVSGGNLAGFNGAVGLDLAGTQNIVDSGGDPLPNAEPATDETYTLTNSPDQIPPTVTITSPAPGATVTGTITLTADASDNSSGVGEVRFLADGVPIGNPDLTAPYSSSFDTRSLSNGVHTLTASAMDTAGNFGTSSGIVVTVDNPSDFDPSDFSFSGPTNGGTSVQTMSTSGPPTVAYGEIVPDAGSGTPSGVGIIQLQEDDGDIVSEASVPATNETQSGSVYVDGGGDGSTTVSELGAQAGDATGVEGELMVRTGIAMSNGSNQAASISFFFTEADGGAFGHGSYTLPANNQLSGFLDEPPFNAPPGLQGTFSFTSSVPIGAIALRSVTNEQGKFLFSTLPVSTGSLPAASAMLPFFADGAGWTTQLVLTNPTPSTLEGTIQFFGQGSDDANSPALIMTVNGVSDSTFSYSIPPNSTVRLATDGSEVSPLSTGSVRIIPEPNSPFSTTVAGILSYRPRGVVVTETSIAVQPTATAFRVYVESSGTGIQSGVAITNGSASPNIVGLELTWLDGTSAEVSSSVTLPGDGQIARFVSELFPELPEGFKGIMKLSAQAPVGVVALRSRYNNEGDFLITTTPPVNDGIAPSSAGMVFPYIVDGGGYSTELILFGQSGQAVSGSLVLRSPDGSFLTNAPFSGTQ